MTVPAPPAQTPPPPSPLIDADSLGFWEAARAGRIALCRCTDPGCGTWLGRPLERCSACGGPTSFQDVSGAGTVYTYIVVHRPTIPAFAHLVPYVVAIVELDEGPRLPGILLGERGPGVAIGQRVQGELTDFPGAAVPALTFRRLPG